MNFKVTACGGELIRLKKIIKKDYYTKKNSQLFNDE